MGQKQDDNGGGAGRKQYEYFRHIRPGIFLEMRN